MRRQSAVQAENDLRVVHTQPLKGVGGEPQKQGIPYGPHRGGPGHVEKKRGFPYDLPRSEFDALGLSRRGAVENLDTPIAHEIQAIGGVALLNDGCTRWNVERLEQGQEVPERLAVEATEHFGRAQEIQQVARRGAALGFEQKQPVPRLIAATAGEDFIAVGEEVPGVGGFGHHNPPALPGLRRAPSWRIIPHPCPWRPASTIRQAYRKCHPMALPGQAWGTGGNPGARLAPRGTRTSDQALTES